MSNFEFVFSLFSILLGLALTQVLGGLARVAEARHAIRIGWPTGLLAAMIVADITIFWHVIWWARDAMPDNSPTLFTGVIICGLYYFAAALVLPSDLAGRRELDSHFDRERRNVLACILLANAVAYSARYALMGHKSFRVLGVSGWAEVILFMVSGAAAMFVRSRKAASALIGVMLLVDLADPLFELLKID